MKFGLSLEPETGKLKLAQGCGSLGCWESPIEAGTHRRVRLQLLTYDVQLQRQQQRQQQRQ